MLTHNRDLRGLVVLTHVARPLAGRATVEDPVTIPMHGQAALFARYMLVAERLDLLADGTRQRPGLRHDRGRRRRRRSRNHLLHHLLLLLGRRRPAWASRVRRHHVRVLLGRHLELLARGLRTRLLRRGHLGAGIGRRVPCVVHHLVGREQLLQQLVVHLATPAAPAGLTHLLGHLVHVLPLDGIAAPELGASPAERRYVLCVLLLVAVPTAAALAGRQGRHVRGPSPLAGVLGTAELAQEAALLLYRLLGVECRVVVIVGHVVGELVGGRFEFLGVLFALAARVIAPYRLATFRPFPDVVVSHDHARADGFDVLLDPVQLGPELGHAFLEFLLLGRAEVGLFEDDLVQRGQLFQRPGSIVLVGVQREQGNGGQVRRSLGESQRRRQGLRLVHVLLHRLVRHVDGAGRGWLPLQLRRVVSAALHPAGRLILDPGHFRASRAFGLERRLLLLVGLAVLFRPLELERLHILELPAGPREHVGLVALAESGAGAREHAVVVVECIVQLAVHAQVAVGPQAGLVDLLGGRGVVVVLVLGRAGAGRVGLGGLVILLVDDLLLVRVGPSLGGGIEHVGRVARLQLALLRATAGGA